MVQENTNKTDKQNKLTSEGSGDADLNLFLVGIDILLTWQGYESKQHKCPASNGSYTRNRQRGEGKRNLISLKPAEESTEGEV